MFNNNKILVVIPARGGSKGIPRKNIRLLNNKPLISYSIDIARASQYVDDVVVTTDDSEIALIAEKLGASVIRRAEELAGDDIPLDPVIYDATIQKEKLVFDEYDIVITLQPTSPLLKPQTLDVAIEKFEDFSVDSVISVVDDRHLSWGYDENNQRYFPNYIERLNRQRLPKSFRETGAILATRRSFMHKDSRLGTNIDLVEVSREESVDILNYEDWWLAKNYLQKKKIAIVVNAYDEIGTRYIQRCLSIASKLVFHEAIFLLDKQHQLGIDIIGKHNYAYKVYEGEENLFNILREYNPNIVINDILDTSAEYIATLKQEGYFVINLEDLGEGTLLADVVFDERYEHDDAEENIFSGYKYHILNDEFYFQPKKIITNLVNNVLIVFKGKDSNNLSQKVLDAILSTNYQGRINVILGLGHDDVESFVSKYESNPLVQIYQNVSNISDFMFVSDIVFTSAGTIIYDVCSLGIPTICFSQDEREQVNKFVNEFDGLINMGLGSYVEIEEIANQFINLINDYEKRVDLNKKMTSIDLKHGFDNMKVVVQEQYRAFEFNGDD